MTRQGASFGGTKIRLLVDTGVRRTNRNFGDWEQLGRGELKETRLKFRPYGTNHYLPIIGRAAVRLKTKAGAVIETRSMSMKTGQRTHCLDRKMQRGWELSQ